MGVSVKPVFNRTNRKNETGLYSIHIRLTINKKSAYYNSELPRIQKKYWSGKENKWIKESHPLSYEFNQQLINKVSFVFESAWKVMKGSPSECFSIIRKRLFLDNNTADFYQYFENKIPRIQLHKNTLKAYTSTLYLCKEYKKQLTFKELNKDYLIGLRKYAKNEREIADVTAKRYFSKLKIICDFAVEDGLMNPDLHPFTDWKSEFKLKKPKRTFLEKEEISALEKLKINDTHLNLVRDQFLALIYTGQYYSDLKSSTWDNIEDTKVGFFLKKERVKNGHEYFVPLFKFPESLELFRRYKKHPSKNIFHKYFSDQEFNRSLKELATLAGIKKNLTNKVGRHTFAQNLINLGTPRAIISKMLGHKKEETTQNYYEVNIESVINYYNL
jgi:site-specific recombinase XerD